MPSTVVLGLQWGDEGKGKIVDMLAADADLVARYQGGQNAGHTMVVEGVKTVTHLLPSGVLQGKPCLLGNGMVIDPVGLYEEMQGMPVPLPEVLALVKISDRAHLLFPSHKLIDGGAQSKEIGTTGKGIGPAYESKVGRRGTLAQSLRHVDKLVETVRLAYEVAGGDASDLTDYLDKLVIAAAVLSPLLVDSAALVNEVYDTGGDLLIEGAQGTWLDIDHGTYPYVTSSNTTIGGACTGLGLPPQKLDYVVGIVKAYTTRVGAGKHATELLDATGDHLRERGNEYGSTTGRPRRVGWLDLVAVKQAILINGVDELAIMKIDVLDELDEILVATAYEVDGAELVRFPSDQDVFEASKPVYQPLPGWKCNTIGMTNIDDLPPLAKAYLDFIETHVGIPIRFISTGPGREETIVV